MNTVSPHLINWVPIGTSRTLRGSPVACNGFSVAVGDRGPRVGTVQHQEDAGYSGPGAEE